MKKFRSLKTKLLKIKQIFNWVKKMNEETKSKIQKFYKQNINDVLKSNFYSVFDEEDREDSIVYKEVNFLNKSL
jgi:hypothetical protein